jgi:elongation factor P
MLTAGEFRKGKTIDIDGNVFVIVDFLHVKPGKGAAFVRTKLKNVMTGQTLERTFNPSDKYPEAVIERKDMQYLYRDGDLCYFMDMETFDQIALNYDICEDALKFMTENMMAFIQFYNGKAFSVEAPNFVELKIVECDPAVAGDTAKSAMKPATLETGFVISVPLFVNNGDTIRVDSRTGEYMERI